MKNRYARFCCLLLLCAGSVLRAEEAAVPLVVEPQGEGEFSVDPRTGAVSAQNGVIVRYGKAYMTAHTVTVNQMTGEVLAVGNVRIENEGQIWVGDRVVYNFKSRHLSTGEFRTGQPPFFVSGPGVDVSFTNRIYVVTNAVFTTDDYASPAYHIQAKQITVVPGKYIEAKGATLRIGKTPIFYWPKLYKSADSHANFWVLTPGYRSLFGPYLMTSYHMTWPSGLEAVMNMDYRVKRGFGVGPDLTWNTPKAGDGMVRYYYTHDMKPGVDPVSLAPIDKDRQRAFFSYLLTPQTNLTIRSMIRYQSDPYIVRDFFETEYRENVQPSTFVEANKDWQNWNLNFYAQPRVNTFQETVERLPDVRLNGMRQSIGDSPFYYESQSSAGFFRHLYGETNDVYMDIANEPYAASRADTYHQIIAPLNLFGWLNLTPRVGGRLSYYGRATGDGATTDETTRAVFNTGMETTFKVSRVWNGASSKFLDVNGIRHIVEPSANYAFVPSPNRDMSQLPQFDTPLPSYWPRPIDYPDYTTIDSIDSQNVVRLGLRNRIQTKREDNIDNLLNWNMFTDVRLSTITNQSTFNKFYSMVDLKPRSWMSLGFLTRYDLELGRLWEQTQMLNLYPNNDWSISLGYRYRDANELGLGDIGNNLFLSSLVYRLDENWAFRLTHQFNFQTGIMEEQSYTIYRDMRSWTGALSLRFRENQGNVNPNDWTIAVSFSLKAFPRYGLNKEVDRPSLLFGS